MIPMMDEVVDEGDMEDERDLLLITQTDDDEVQPM
jgi:hypothetical protein